MHVSVLHLGDCRVGSVTEVCFCLVHNRAATYHLYLVKEVLSLTYTSK
jgi:hypothetical protein